MGTRLGVSHLLFFSHLLVRSALIAVIDEGDCTNAIGMETWRALARQGDEGLFHSWFADWVAVIGYYIKKLFGI